ncbi:glycosyltransferase family 2 protein [Vibrio parahaemolyticus]|nr:glycosyltransferase family 2 protein [Vibrio parahaemolyticus]EJC6849064.1 glycosyltransferase family 2 protein [Vibrio parahaemolyticus]EJC7136384.1 glycosyltransferase family 2 protein [Vibrio parahaemolyticus]EKG9569039.1 glycosyltransferase family 2 protein [Vibrio parahaemolyticus]EKG9571787.1 glycosyltransferase family 2 protein [Vibrio parahaemolyticus]
MLLSIILPAYNVEKYIRDCLESIQSQLTSNIEVIVVDDGSNDSTRKIIEEFSFVKAFYQSNGGQSKARNLGLSKSQGKYIWFVDSDDMLIDGAIGKAIDTLDSLDIKNENVDIIAFDGDYFIDCKDILFNTKQLNYFRPKFKEKIITQNEFFNVSVAENRYFVQPCHYIFKRSLSYDVNFVEGIIYEDNLFTTDLFINGERRIFVLNEIMYKRRIRLDSTVTSKFGEKNTNSFNVVVSELISKRETYESFVDVRYLDRYISSMIDSYYVSLLRVRKTSINYRLRSLFKMYKISKNLVSYKTVLLAIIPNYIYKFIREVR